MSTNMGEGAQSAQPADVQPAAQSIPLSDFRLFNPPRTGDSAGPREPPDAFFTPTTSDLKAAQASLTARTQALMNAPLKTQVMRDAEQKASQAKYPTTTIRIRFSDRHQLEKTFPSTDKIRSVYAFVRSSLREDVRPIKFVLFQTPPRRELKVSDPKVRDLNLLQLQLAPSSILHIKFEDDSLNHVHISAPLAPEILAKAEDLPIPPPFDSESPKANEGPSSSSGAKEQSSSKSAGKAIPRWLKMGPNR